MNHFTIKIEKTAHYYTNGEPSANTRYFWIVAHGYGQLASSIMRKFSDFDPATHFILAPEALNRFYWDMRKGEVGASWMTKRDRLDEIADYTAYLSQLYKHFRGQMSDDVQVIYLGFSQGCATLCRWLFQGEDTVVPLLDEAKGIKGGALLMPHKLVLWGGLLPEDIDYEPFRTIIEKMKIIFVCGDEDEFINAENIAAHAEFAKKQHIALDFIPFSGKHEVLVPVLQDVFNQKLAE